MPPKGRHNSDAAKYARKPPAQKPSASGNIKAIAPKMYPVMNAKGTFSPMIIKTVANAAETADSAI